MSVNVNQISIPPAGEEPAWKKLWCQRLKANTELQLEIWLNYSLKFQDLAYLLEVSHAESHRECLCRTGSIPNSPSSPASLLLVPVRCWTLNWWIKLWKSGPYWLLNGALWRCHTESSRCPSLYSTVACQLPVYKTQCRESLYATERQGCQSIAANS